MHHTIDYTIKNNRRFTLTAALCLLLFYGSQAQKATDTLLANFKNPPPVAKPRVWWHWTGSNVTKEGITKDLEWMKRAGIGGFQAFDVSLGGGQNVDKKIIFMTTEWLDAIRHTAAEADRLGLEMTMATSAGWSETGGPWVKPEEAVKKVVWSEVQVTGGIRFTGKLPTPPSVNGPIRNLPRKTLHLGGPTPPPDPTFYADQVVLAYRTPAEEKSMAALHPIVNSSAGLVDNATPLWDDDLTTSVSLPVPTVEKPSWIQFQFAQPFTARAFSIALQQISAFGSSTMRSGYIQASDDGKTFRTLTPLPGPQHDIRGLPVRTFAFPQANARFYRVVFTQGSGISTVGGPDDYGGFGAPATPPVTFDITEAVFHSGGRVHRWEDKANFAHLFEYEGLPTPPVPRTAIVNPDSIINLASQMKSDGSLDWQVPAGTWTILRIGYSLTGAKNTPAVPQGTGFEVDKLNKQHLEKYYSSYTQPIAKAMGTLYGKSMKYFLADSYEADAQNWTDNMIPEFQKRRGYDPTPYLPTLAGRIVKSAEISDRFLWDFRRTIADLLTENHYEALAKLAHDQGIKLYSEAAGISLPVIEDALQVKGRVDIPMGEFGMGLGLSSEGEWKTPADLEATDSYRGAAERMNAHQADVREAASAAHIYGKPVVATESWTGGGYEAPASLKPIGDYWHTQGANQFIIHTSAHQPLDTKPGNVMVGTHFHRNITWAELALPFTMYLARNQYLLQQGKFVADIAYYVGESIPAAVPYWKQMEPKPPAGYDYDFVNTEILLDSMTVKDGRLVLSNGMTYQVLVLRQTDKMTLPVLQKIRDLVVQGAAVVGPKPVQSPSLKNYPAEDAQVALLANEMWGDADGKLVFQHSYGKGAIYWGIPLEGILASHQVQKDFQYTHPHTNTYLTAIHRKTGEADIYFVSNRRAQVEEVAVTLRIYGKAPELWHPDRGTTEQASYSMADSLTTVSLRLEPQQSLFIILRKPTDLKSWQAPKVENKILAAVTGSWQITFPPNLGAPDKMQLDSLVSWTNVSINGVKYFSGTATYTKTIQADKQWFRTGAQILLDLGTVKDIAEVLINGKAADTLWKVPYRADVTRALKPGANQVQIKVTNQWTNRIRGDQRLPENKRILPGGFSPFMGGHSQELIESGLIGPVRLWLVNMK